MDLVIGVIFWVLAALILGSGLMVVIVKNIIHAALWLIASFGGIAALYFLLEAPFIGVAQILVYAGAVSILMLFAIMLTRQVTGGTTRELFDRWWMAAFVAVGILVLIILTIRNPGLPANEAGLTTWPQQDRALAATATSADATPDTPGDPAAPQIAGALEIGASFMNEYLLPFEIASVLLLVALLGAIVIAQEERSRRRRVLTLSEETALRRSVAGLGTVEPLHAIPGPQDQGGTSSSVGSSAGTDTRR